MPSTEKNRRVIEVDFRRDPRWLEFLASHPDATIYHHPGWLAALECEYGRQCKALACEDGDGRLEAVLPLLSTRGLPFSVSKHSIRRRLSSLPRTPLAGPLATNPAAMKAVLYAAIELVQKDPHLQLEIKTTTPGLDKLVPALRCINWRQTFVRGLPRNEIAEPEFRSQETRKERPCCDCNECRSFRFGDSREHHQIKWAAKKARREGISVRPVENEQELRKWYPLYLEVMRRNVVPPRSYRFFLRLWHELGASGHMAFVLAERHKRSGENEMDSDSSISATNPDSELPSLVSGSILLQFSQTAFWAFTGSTPGGLKCHANDLILWHCLHDSCKKGFNWFDLGEVAEAHPELIQFKAKWGSILKPMYRYYYPPSSAPSDRETGFTSTAIEQVASSIWQRLPLTVVAALGDLIFRFL